MARHLSILWSQPLARTEAGHRLAHCDEGHGYTLRLFGELRLSDPLTLLMLRHISDLGYDVEVRPAGDDVMILATDGNEQFKVTGEAFSAAVQLAELVGIELD